MIYIFKLALNFKFQKMNNISYNTLSDFYEVHETIGCGGFCKVKLATHIATGEKVAIKIIDKIALKDDLKRAYAEIEALKDLKHSNIIKLYQVIETESMLYMIIEYCVGGELFDYIIARDKIPEDEARLYFRQILSPLAYLHSRGYAHRDLKPENILLDGNSKLKLIDFGLCAQFQDKMALRLDTCCGSPAYAAPELISGDPYIGSEVDIWSLGVLLYTLLCGFLPFDDDNLSNLYRKIILGHYTIPKWLTSSASALLSRMLETNPARRINTKQLLTHPWVNKGLSGESMTSLLFKDIENESFEMDILKEIAIYADMDIEEIEEHIMKGNRDYFAATYFLLIKRKKQGKSIRVNMEKLKLTKNSRKFMNQVVIGSKRKRKLYLGGSNYKDDSFKVNSHNLDDSEFLSLKNSNQRESGFCSYQSDIGGKNAYELNSNRNPPLSPARSYDGRLNEDEMMEDNFVFNRTKSLESHLNISDDGSNKYVDAMNKNTKQTNKIWKTPIPNKANNESAKNLLGSIEKGIDKIRNIFSPARKNGEDLWNSPSSVLNPRDVKILNNVSTSSLVNPNHIILMLKEALTKRGFIVKQKGLRLRGKLEDEQKKTLLTFELEIVFIPEFKIYGIRRKRLIGDSWHYKKICEEILTLTSPTDSSL